MPVNTALAVTISAGVSLYRITAVSFHTPNAAHHKKVVNGMGARKSHAGGRYNYGGVLGIQAPSSRSTTSGEMIVLFDDQSKNVDLDPYTVEFRLVTDVPGVPFSSHATQLLDFTAGEVRFVGGTPPGVAGYAHWTPVTFNH